MLWIQRRFLSRCADLLRTEAARTYFQMIAARLKALQKDGHDLRINNSSSIKHLENVTILADTFYDKMEMLSQLYMLLKGCLFYNFFLFI